MRKTSKATKSVRVFLVDDHPLVRQALKDAIGNEGDLEVCGEAEDRDEALRGIAASAPDLAIVDLQLKTSNGLDLVKDLCNHFPNVLSLVLSMQDESMTAERAIRAGARGYVSKQEASGKIIEALRKVLRGEIYWSKNAAALVAPQEPLPVRRTNGFPLDRLSERELQVFEMIGIGNNSQQISELLHIDISTVETYRSHIKEKLDLTNGPELLQTAIRWSSNKSSHLK